MAARPIILGINPEDSVQLAALTKNSELLPDWLAQYAGSSTNEVLAFCHEKKILEEAGKAVDLAKRVFRSNTLRLEIQSDPEGEGSWLTIEVSVRGRSVDDVLATYRQYKRELTDLVLRPQRDAIRIIYNIV